MLRDDSTMASKLDDDEYVANLLKQDAKNATKKYELVGIDAFNSKRCVANRFDLRNCSDCTSTCALCDSLDTTDNSQVEVRSAETQHRFSTTPHPPNGQPQCGAARKGSRGIECASQADEPRARQGKAE